MATGPIRYLAQPEDPFTQALKGVQTVATLSKIKAQREASERADLAAKQAATQKAQYRSDVETAFNKGTPKAFAELTSKYPGQANAFKQSFSMLSKEQQKNELGIAGQVHTALQNNNLDVANKILDEQITATENKGGDVTNLKNFQESIRKNPDMAKGMSSMFLSSVMGPDKFMATYEKLDAVERAKERAPLELEKLKEEVTTAKDKLKIRALEAKLRKEKNEIERKKLGIQIDNMKKKQEIEASDRIAVAEGALSTLDNTISGAERLLSHPGLEAATGATSIFMGSIPGTEAREFTGLVETLKSQTFLAEVEKMKGMGALSENEGKKIAASVANLDLGQSSDAFKGNLRSALKTFKTGRKRIIDKYGDVLKKEEEPAEVVQETTTATEAAPAKSYLKYRKAP
jgi:hypothetical protein